MKRDNLGRLDLNDSKILNDFIIGIKEKIWLERDNKKYLFKCGASNYEIYAELISSELAHQCGFPTAEYDIATVNGKTGVVTPSFLNMGDIIISGEKYLKDADEIALQNNFPYHFKENSIKNIYEAVLMIDGKTDNVNKILFDLLQLWCFDIVILESDRNKTNWSIIRNREGNARLAPIYDCSTMARMNTDIVSVVGNLRSENQIYNIIDSIQYSLKINDEKDCNFYRDLEYLCQRFPNEISLILESIKKINVDKAIEKVEDKINEGMEEKVFLIPHVIKIWLSKAIGIRKNEMIAVYNRVMNKPITNLSSFKI